MDMRGYSLIEIILATAILAVLVVPVSMLFSTSSAQFDQHRDRLFAHQVGRLVLERAAFRAAHGHDLPSHDYLGIMASSSAVSPYLIPFDASAAGVDEQEWKQLAVIMKDYRVKVQISNFSSGPSSVVEVSVIVSYVNFSQQRQELELKTLLALAAGV